MKNKTIPSPPRTSWLALMRSGDFLIFALCAAAVVFAILHFWQTDAPRTAIVRAGGNQVASLPLDRAANFEVSGPLGMTHIEVQPGRARVASDPGPHQYCVKQGWLTRAGSIAICAPNHVSLSLEGRRAAYDSLSY